MAHKLEIINGQAQMFSVRQTPWHKLGKVLDSPPTSEEAIIEAGLDWEVSLRDIAWKKENACGEEWYEDIPNRKCIVRLSDDKPFSIVSKTYKPLQNKEAFEWFDTFVGNGMATYETAGSLCGGRKIWVLAKLKDSMEVVKGDEVRKYILLCNGHDGVTSVLLQPTPIRVVCDNTLSASLGTGLVNSIWHQGDIKRKMDRVKRALGLAEEDFKEKKEIYEGMARFQMDNIKIGTYVKSLIPDANKEATDRVKNSVTIAQEKIWDLHENGLGSDITGVKGTMWGVYNSAVEYSEYYAGPKVRDRANYSVFGIGSQFKKRAFTKAVELMGA